MRSITTALSCAALILIAATGAAGQGTPLGSPIAEPPLGRIAEGYTVRAQFAASQLTFPRVAQARASAEGRLRLLFHDADLPYPAPEIFLRVFKHERSLEVWVRPDGDSAFRLLKEYPVCALPGQLGPKSRLGDVQVPEGFYFIDEFNPRSNYHLSLRVNYPNLADHMRRKAMSLGGDIYIHGGCETIGCVPIEDGNIEEVYWMAVQAMDAGQRIIPVHIFPTRMEPERLKWLTETFDPEPELLAFWHELVDGYRYFEDTRQVPWITVAADGHYVVPEPARLADRDGEPGADRTAEPVAVDAEPADSGTDHGPARSASGDGATRPAGDGIPDAGRPAPSASPGATPAAEEPAGSGTAEREPSESAGGPVGRPVAPPSGPELPRGLPVPDSIEP